MKKLTLFAALGALLCFAPNVGAQRLGDLISSKVKKAATGAASQTLHKASLPWMMEEKTTREDIEKYIYGLGDERSSDEIKGLYTFREELRARAHEDSAIVALKSHDALYREAEKELDKYEMFLFLLGDCTTRLNFTGKIDEKYCTLEHLMVRIGTTSAWVWEDKNSAGKQGFYFHNMSGEKIFVEDDQMQDVYKDVRRYAYVEFFLEGIKDKELRKQHDLAHMCYYYLQCAKENNNPANIDRLPMPTPGSLNSLAAQALAAAKKNSSYADGVKVIIDANAWDIERDALGNPIRRKCGGWVIKNTKYGKEAWRAQWCEEHMGGGKYGALKLYGVGGGRHFVK